MASVFQGNIRGNSSDSLCLLVDRRSNPSLAVLS